MVLDKRTSETSFRSICGAGASSARELGPRGAVGEFFGRTHPIQGPSQSRPTISITIDTFSCITYSSMQHNCH